jgi:ATP-dependent Clp protease ATP-binding subunit ClpC
MEQLRRAFRPEFLNRVSGTIVFRSLTKDEITAIVDLELKKVRERLSEHALMLDMTREAKDFLAEKGYDPEYGARPLRRVITNLVEDKLSDGILSGTFKIGSTVHIDVKDGEMVFTAMDSPNGSDGPHGLPDVALSTGEGEVDMATPSSEAN